MGKYGKTLVESCFVLVFSQNHFSLFEEFIEDNIFEGGGPLPGPQSVWKDMYLSGVGEHFQVLEVSEGTCTVLRTKVT